ncbi:MAG: tetratricopeptide repeat protein [Ktedonobacteraceae bacterium]|nr:tetratricopeptide repeat protein [Ktedonobacteraceae bacterium]
MDSSFQNTTGETREADTYCLGPVPHKLRAEEVVCSTCGELLAGAHLGVYQVQRRLGRGRSGSAYLAIHRRTGYPVALKLFAPLDESSKLWEAARREVRVVMGLRHPSILPVYSCSILQPAARTTSAALPFAGTHSPYLLTLCQYAPTPLAQVIASSKRSSHQSEPGRQPTDDLLSTPQSLLVHLLHLIRQIGSALYTAHLRGIVHGALVPGNILIMPDHGDQILLADFGLARLHPPPGPFLAPELLSMSRPGRQQGIDPLRYWEAVTPLADQYAFAVLCEYLLTRLLRAADYEPLLPALQAAKQENPARRFASIEHFVQALETQAGHAQRLSLKHTSRSTDRSTDGLPLGHTPLSDTLDTLPLHESPFSSPLRKKARSSEGDYASRLRTPPSLTSLTPPAIHTDPGLFPLQTNNSGPFTPIPGAPQHLPRTPFQTSQMPPSPETSEWERRGDKLFTVGDYEGAARAYQQALSLQPDNAVVCLALGDSYFALEHYQEALRAYERALLLNPDDPQIWTNRGTALDALGRRKDAEDSYEYAERLRSG